MPDTPDALTAFFMARVRDNLHILLCLSPVGPCFAARVRQFPALFAAATVDWFLPWSKDALVSVAETGLARLAGGEGGGANASSTPTSTSLASVAAGVHAAVDALCAEYRASHRRSVHVTPKSFLAFVDAAAGLHTAEAAALTSRADAVAAGLAKMDEAKVGVGAMRVELEEKKRGLAAAGAAADALLANISASTAATERDKARVATIVDAVTAQAASIAAVQAGAAADLAAAQPALDAALAALQSITPKDIQSLKALKNPPDVVKRIFDCVLLLRWGEGERGRRGRGRDARGRAPTQHPPSDPFIAASPSRAPPGKTSRVPWCSKATTRPRCA